MSTYIADMIGMEVYAQKTEMNSGTLKDVMETGANDVYVIDSPGTWRSADSGD